MDLRSAYCQEKELFHRLGFEIDCDADDEAIAKLLSLTERYCVIYQTLVGGIEITTNYDNSGLAS